MSQKSLSKELTKILIGSFESKSLTDYRFANLSNPENLSPKIKFVNEKATFVVLNLE